MSMNTLPETPKDGLPMRWIRIIAILLTIAAVVVSVMREDPQQYAVIYVGQTEDLAARFEDHHKRSCMASHGANRIAVRVERDEAERLAIENDLITAYRPPCNG